MAYRKNPVSREELRQLAGERILRRGASATPIQDPVQAQQLLEELEIRQIELELQNEQLNAVRAQLEMALEQSCALYEFAPVGRLTLDRNGAITKSNLVGARLLGSERSRLQGSLFGGFVAEADRPAFKSLFEQAVVCGDVEGGEITLAGNGGHAVHVQISIAALPENSGCQVVLVDMTDRRQVEEQLRENEERWKLALEAAGDGVWDWNLQTGEATYSRRFEQLFGFDEHEFGSRIQDKTSRIHPDDKPFVMAELQAHLAGKTAHCFNEHRGQCKDGSWKWVLSRGAIVSHSEDGKPLRMIGTHVDITRRKQAEDALRAVTRFKQAVFDAMQAQIAVLDRHGTIIQTNATWRNAVVNGACASTTIGLNYLEVLDCMTVHDQETLLAAADGIAAVMAGELDCFQLKQPFHAQVDQRWFIMKATPIQDGEGRVVICHEDVSKLKAAELASLTLLNTDALTGALSRRHFLSLAEQELSRSIRYKLPLMLLMLDLDHFKRINDHYGHAAGDAVLQGFVQTVTGILRESDLIGRLGGEEFAVLLPNTTLEGGRTLAQRIVELVRVSPIDAPDQRIVYTVSIGVACLSTETSFSDLLKLADAALYRAKNAGRDRLEVGLEMPGHPL